MSCTSAKAAIVLYGHGHKGIHERMYIFQSYLWGKLWI